MLLTALTVSSLSAQSVDTIALRAHTRFLASDLLEGRGTGTRGEHLAGLYIAAQLARMGAQPIANNDYFLPIPLKRAIIDDRATTITLNNITYHSTTDFVWNTGGRGALRSFSGPLTFVGRADSAAAARAGDLRGRVVVIAGAMGAAAGDFVPALIKNGAVGVILLVPDNATFDLYVRSRGDSRFFVDADVNDPVWQADLPIVIAGPSLARAIVKDGVPMPFSQINGQLSANFKANVVEVASANVAGVIRGSDPKLANEYVAFSAHYDHLGISTPDEQGDSIYNGFSDDAAGVAMVLGIGDVFIKQRPLRSVLLIFFTGEERGLLGSSYYASHPALPLNKMVGLINIDAGAPPARPLDWSIRAGNETPLGAVARKALALRKWEAVSGPSSPNSDYWPFLKRGAPAIFVVPGNKWENTTAEQQKALRTEFDHYHQASDEWRPDFPFSGIQRYAEVALIIGKAVLNKK
ncbi:MAG TPA: M28 family peptidase [Longimicrobiales bacterium]|nr:M28 family peptidase [Longimicrobiales bacterium]